MSEIEITRIYRCRIDYESSVDDGEKIEAQAFKWANKNTDVETFSGNAVCSPYLEAETTSMVDISVWGGKIQRYIKRFSSTRLI
jgi:isopentenyldiphosphate isomerase